MAQIDWTKIISQGDTGIGGQIPSGRKIDYISEPHVACCLLVDTSGSMTGSKIAELNEALRSFKTTVCKDPLAAKRVDVCVVEFNERAQVVTPFCPISQFVPPTLSARSVTSMATGIRFALEAVHKQVSRYHAAGIDCYKPFVLMITDGAPTEDMAGIAELIAAREGEGRYGHLRFHAFGVKGADMDLLASLTHRVLAIDNNAFKDVFNWLSNTMQIISNSIPTDNVTGSDLEQNMYPYDAKTRKLPWND